MTDRSALWLPGRSPGRRTAPRAGSLLFLLVATLVFPGDARGQELEPRAFSAVPVRVNFVALGYNYSFGNYLLDPSIPIENGRGKVHSVAGVYVRTFSLLGMSAKTDAVVPFAFGDWEGDVEGARATRSATGFGDPAFRLSVNFLGAPALDLPAFAKYRPGTIVGASLRVFVPLGQYDRDRLINLGANRWTFMPRVGASRRLGKWTVEALATVRLFTTNSDFFGGNTLEQDPLWAVQGGVSYVFGRGGWIAVDGGWAWGGRTTVNGTPAAEDQQSARFGATLNYPLTRRASLKLVWVSGITARLGADFDTIGLFYQYRWGGGL